MLSLFGWLGIIRKLCCSFITTSKILTYWSMHVLRFSFIPILPIEDPDRIISTSLESLSSTNFIVVGLLPRPLNTGIGSASLDLRFLLWTVIVAISIRPFVWKFVDGSSSAWQLNRIEYFADLSVGLGCLWLTSQLVFLLIHIQLLQQIVFPRWFESGNITWLATGSADSTSRRSRIILRQVAVPIVLPVLLYGTSLSEALTLNVLMVGSCRGPSEIWTAHFTNI